MGYRTSFGTDGQSNSVVCRPRLFSINLTVAHFAAKRFILSFDHQFQVACPEAWREASPQHRKLPSDAKG